MIIMILLKRINDVSDEIKRGSNKYPNCTEVYLFGSFLKKDIPNDIDILVVYDDSECDINTQLNTLSTLVETVSNLPVDMTALSKEEIKETSFLNRIYPNYIRII